jgi:hypothetical protein
MIMDLSYQEKSILGNLLATLVVYGYYFANALSRAAQAESNALKIGRLIFTVIAIVAIQIVYHIILALEAKPEPKDERDVLIECQAYRNGYFVLNIGAFLVIQRVIMAIQALDVSPTTRNISTPFLVVNLMLLFMVLAELVKLLTQLFYYRRGLR